MQASYPQGQTLYSFAPSKSELIKLGLVIIGALALLSIIFIKSHAFSLYGESPLLLLYTFFITTFQLSRVAGAILYKKMDSQIAGTTIGVGLQNYLYEPKVSIVIPCKNEEKSIEKTLRQCFLADYPKEKLEVIVINDGSTDRTGEILRSLEKEFSRLTVVHWEINKGKRHGMAEGFRRAIGDIVVQLDSDSYMVPETFRQIILPFRYPEIGAVCAHTDPENPDVNLLTKMQTAYYFMSFRILKAAESTFMTVFCCSGCASAYRKNLILPILDKWLEEKFLGLPVTWGDDRALTNWVLRQEYRTIYTHRARAYTVVPENFKQFFKQQIRWKKGWFVNSVFATKFIIRKQPFVAFTYFLPLLVVTVLTPFMATRALIYNPIFNEVKPVYYVLGVFLMTLVITVYYRIIAIDNKYWPYIFIWSGLNMVLLSFFFFYALLTIQNRKWGTR